MLTRDAQAWLSERTRLVDQIKDHYFMAAKGLVLPPELVRRVTRLPINPLTNLANLLSVRGMGRSLNRRDALTTIQDTCSTYETACEQFVREHLDG